MIYAAEYGLVFWVLFLIPGIFYLLTIKALSFALDNQSKKFKLWTIWICLVPVLGALWLPVIATEVSRSLSAEYKRRNTTSETGYSAAIVILIVTIVGMATPGLAIITFLITLIAWVLHWVAIRNGKKQLASP